MKFNYIYFSELQNQVDVQIRVIFCKAEFL
jgi:hypothetical protein